MSEEDSPDYKERPNKSELKRQADKQQTLGLKIAALSPKSKNTIAMPDALIEAINAYNRIGSNRAKKRGAQWIGKQMRKLSEEELAQIEQDFEKIQAATSAINSQFHLVEKWRDLLISGNSETLTDFLNSYATSEVQSLRQLIKKAQKEVAENKNLGAKKALFKLIRQIIEAHS